MSTRGLTPTAFVFFLQNHDQIGNRAFGERITVLTDAETLEAAIALQLLAPQVPLIFMGEETGAREPFLYFTDHRDPTLAGAVREGRRREFTKFPEFADEQKRGLIPDPNALETFRRSVPDLRPNATSALYTELLRLRQQHLFPRLRGVVSEGAQAIGPAAIVAHWRLDDGTRLTIACNLGKEAVTAAVPDAEPLWGERPRGTLSQSTTVVWIEAP
jgi:maltooligosyltrehalose trehalohydrolase